MATVTVEMVVDNTEDFAVVGKIIESLSELGPSVEVTTDGSTADSASDESSPEDVLTPDHQIVLDAIRRKPGKSRKIIHREAVELDGSSFSDPEDRYGERKEVGTLSWELEDLGLVRHEGNCWYPLK